MYAQHVSEHQIRRRDVIKKSLSDNSSQTLLQEVFKAIFCCQSKKICEHKTSVPGCAYVRVCVRACVDKQVFSQIVPTMSTKYAPAAA